MKKFLASVLIVALLATLLITTAFADTNYDITEVPYYTPAYIFSDGLAAVHNDDKVGYVDTEGNLVIDFKFDYKTGMGTTCTGKFIDGKTIVFKNISGRPPYEILDWSAFELHYIDKTGEIIGEVGDEDISQYLCFDYEGIDQIEINGKTYDARISEGIGWAFDYDASRCWIVKEKDTTEKDEAENTEPSEWAKAEIDKAENYGITANLYSNYNIENNYYQKNITREEFASLIVGCIETLEIGWFAPLEENEEYIPIDEDATLKDIYGFEFVDTDNDDVYLAYEMGIVKGVGNDMFAPKQNITRQEIAVMMHRAIKYVEQEKDRKYITDNNTLKGFTDFDLIADWAVDSVGVLANNGIMKGTGEATLSPLDNTSREQAIMLAVRIFELLQ